MSHPKTECPCDHVSDFHDLELGRCYACSVDCFFKHVPKPCPRCGVDEPHESEEACGAGTEASRKSDKR